MEKSVKVQDILVYGGVALAGIAVGTTATLILKKKRNEEELKLELEKAHSKIVRKNEILENERQQVKSMLDQVNLIDSKLSELTSQGLTDSSKEVANLRAEKHNLLLKITNFY